MEALYLKAHQNEDSYDPQDEEFGYRVEASYQGAGLGFRIRFFDWEGTGGSSDYYPELSALDLEVFEGFQLGNWEGEFSAGLRRATFEETDFTDFDGWGPTLGIEMTREISGPFSIYAAARASLVYGDEDYYDEEEYISIVELSGGVQYDFGACSYVRLGIEAQTWESASEDDHEDTALFGGALEVGFGF